MTEVPKFEKDAFDHPEQTGDLPCDESALLAFSMLPRVGRKEPGFALGVVTTRAVLTHGRPPCSSALWVSV